MEFKIICNIQEELYEYLYDNETNFSENENNNTFIKEYLEGNSLGF